MGEIRKAVFPVAGFGTRFLPATKASPKEMLAVVDKPLIQYAVEEAYASGIREMIFVTGRHKRSIEDHFDTAYELEAELELSGKLELKALLHSITPDDMQCVYIRQPKALGLGHAILCAESVVGNEPFAVLLADELTVAKTPVIKQLINIHNQTNANVIGLKNVNKSETKNYGIISGSKSKPNQYVIENFVEKPDPENAPSTLAISGRYILNSEIFIRLKSQTPGIAGEIQLTDSLIKLKEDQEFIGLEYEGQTFDCGSKLGFMQASVEIAKSHPQIGKEFTTWLQT